MTTYRFFLGGFVVCFMPIATWAGLIGSQVTGSYTNTEMEAPNYFDPTDPTHSNIYSVPSSYLNTNGTTVTIQEPAIEFGDEQAPCRCNLFWANFTDNQLTIHNTAGFTYSDNLYFQFTDTAFSGITEVSSDWSTTGISYSLSGDTISIDFLGVSAAGGQNYDAVFNVVSTPEPSTLLLIAVGCVGLTLKGHRRSLRLHGPFVKRTQRI